MRDNSQEDEDKEEEENKTDTEADADTETDTDIITVIRTAINRSTDEAEAETQLVKLQRMFIKLY